AKAVGAERRVTIRLQQIVLHPWRRLRRRTRTGRAGFPDRALEGIGDIDVSGRVEGHGIEPEVRRHAPRNGHEDRGGAGMLIDIEHLAGAEIDHEKRAGVRMEADPEDRKSTRLNSSHRTISY